MDDFLTPISTTKVKRSGNTSPLIQEQIPRSSLVVPVDEQLDLKTPSTITGGQSSSRTPATSIDERQAAEFPTVSLRNQETPRSSLVRDEINTPDKALEALKNQPDPATVSKVIKYLATESDKNHGVSLINPDPLSGNIAYQLVNSTIPDYWGSFKAHGSQAKHLIRCLQNPAGIGAIITRLRPLIADCRQRKPIHNTRDPSSHIEDLLDVLGRLLRGDQFVAGVWLDVQAHAKNAMQTNMAWKQFVIQIASGQLLSLAAEAEDVLKDKGSSHTATWLASGSDYADWLGRNISSFMREADENDISAQAVVDLCVKALLLGYSDRIITSMLLSLISTDSVETMTKFLPKMKVFDRRKYMNAIISFIARHYFGTGFESKEDAPLKASPTVSAAAMLIYSLTKQSDLIQEIVSVLTKSTLSALDDSLSARRSLIAVVAQDEDRLHNLLENSIKLFGDTFYIKHTSILQQEALAQTLAITCGYVQRLQPLFLTMMAKSSYQVSGMSNRIGSSSPRARFLGIAVGMAISKMVDRPDLQLKFDLEGNEAEEAKWFQRLTQIDDKLGKIENLKMQTKEAGTKQTAAKPNRTSIKTPKVSSSSSGPVITEIQGPRIMEVLSESEDDDLVPYDKPDSDPEDSDDDPTVVNRNKSTAPVYIRDLLTGLRNQEDPDVHFLALSTAASLIRRKSSFGTEVIDHIEDLATILVGLNDNFDIDEFEEKRQQALIAILLAKPAPMAQWFARSFFSGDYSLTQRTAMLTTLALGARELAGFKDSSTEKFIPPNPGFASKQLPPHLHALYSTSPSDKLSKLSSSTAKEMLSPLATQAADSLTGPSILKVRTFSSRMAVEKTRKKPIPNALAQIVADNFFFPLTGRWWLATQSPSKASTTSSSWSSTNLYTSVHLLPPFLQTLALLLQSTGPNTLSLPQLTTESFALLLSLRTLALSEPRILAALLFALLMLLDTNEDKERLATEHGTEVLETMEWVRRVFDELPGGGGKGGEGGGEEERVRGLAAGVVVRCQEVVEKYQRRLVGHMMDY